MIDEKFDFDLNKNYLNQRDKKIIERCCLIAIKCSRAYTRKAKLINDPVEKDEFLEAASICELVAENILTVSVEFPYFFEDFFNPI